jgi:O-antigen/teichoic acid export membrane protein
VTLRSGLKRVEDGLASLSYEGVVVVSSLLTFYVLFTRLDTADYGVLVGIAGLSGTASLALVSWAQPWLLEAVMQQGRPLGDAVRRVLRVVLKSTVLCALITLGLGSFLVPDASWVMLLAGAVADGMANGVGFVLAGVVHLRSSFVRAALTRTAIALVRPVIVVILLVTGNVTLEAYLVGVGALFVVVVTALWWTVRHDLRPTGELALGDRTIVAEGAQYGVVSLSWALQEDFDKTLLNTFGYAADAGTYAAGYKFVQMATLPIKALVTASHHRFLNPGETPREHLQRAVRLTSISVVYGVAATAGLLVGLEVIERRFAEQFGDAVSPARWLCGLIILRAFVWYPFNALLAFGRRRLRTGIVVGSSLLNLGLNLAFIPAFSWKAALVSTYITEVVFALASWIAVIHGVRSAEAAAASALADTAGGTEVADVADVADIADIADIADEDRSDGGPDDGPRDRPDAAPRPGSDARSGIASVPPGPGVPAGAGRDVSLAANPAEHVAAGARSAGEPAGASGAAASHLRVVADLERRSGRDRRRQARDDQGAPVVDDHQLQLPLDPSGEDRRRVRRVLRWSPAETPELAGRPAPPLRPSLPEQGTEP